MFAKLKAAIFFSAMTKRRNIDRAYAMVGPEDSWYDTITTVHRSLAELQKSPHETLEITSHDGLKLKGIYYPCEGECKGTMIWVHGYTSHAERESAFPGLFYRSLGFNLLIPYLRSHGDSEGRSISLGLLESRDIEKWVQKVNMLHPKGRIVLHGLSMGGAVVLHLADKEMENVCCIVSDAPVVNLVENIRKMTGKIFKKDGDRVADRFFEIYRKSFRADPAELDGIKSLSASRYRIFLTAGSEEKMDGDLEKLRRSCAKDATVLILPGCNHGNGMYKQTELYQNALRDFIMREE